MLYLPINEHLYLFACFKTALRWPCIVYNRLLYDFRICQVLECQTKLVGTVPAAVFRNLYGRPDFCQPPYSMRFQALDIPFCNKIRQYPFLKIAGQKQQPQDNRYGQKAQCHPRTCTAQLRRVFALDVVIQEHRERNSVEQHEQYPK
ncbi:hypothetical protein D9M70_561920 [compost metagenome]